MESFIHSVKAILPILIMIMLGVFCRRWFHVGNEVRSRLNSILFYVILPCLLFENSYKQDLSSLTQWGYIGFSILCLLFCCLVLALTVPRFFADRKRAGALVHAGMRTNAMFIGVPVALGIFGEEQAFPVILLLTVMSAFVNLFSVIILTCFATSIRDVKPVLLLKGVAKNPVIIGLAVGFGCNFLSVPMPEFLWNPICSLSDCCTPLAMLLLGMGFSLPALEHDFRPVFVVSLVKTVLWPVLFTVGAVLAGFRGLELGAIYTFYAMPTAVNCSIVTEAMGCEGGIAGEVTVLTTIISMVTICIGFTVLKSLALI